MVLENIHPSSFKFGNEDIEVRVDNSLKSILKNKNISESLKFVCKILNYVWNQKLMWYNLKIFISLKLWILEP